MVYRVRVSDEIYKLLYAKACEADLSIEDLTELCILDGIRNDAPHPERAGSRSADPYQGTEAQPS